MCSVADERVALGFGLVDSIEHTCRLMHTLSVGMVGTEDTFGIEVSLHGLYIRLGKLLEELEQEREETEKEKRDAT
ncbi:MAG: hypothetical protein WC145_11650 [Aliarcobacter sp.]|jgi:hypothetical protein